MRTKRAENLLVKTNRVIVINGATACVAYCTDCKANSKLLIAERTRRLAWCIACRTKLTMMECDKKPDSPRITSYVVKQWVDGGATQFIKTAEGITLIILISIPERERESSQPQSNTLRQPQADTTPLPSVPAPVELSFDPTCPPQRLASTLR